MWLIDKIAEAQILAAIDKGEFDDLEGAGKPLNIDDDSLVPSELRMAYKVLRNAGYVPEEVRLRKAIYEVEGLLETLDEKQLALAVKRLNLLRGQLSAIRGGRINLHIEEQYYRKIMKRIQALKASRSKGREP